jgi:tripartite-type tricarboxylate transporter receptor subunit TctC
MGSIPGLPPHIKDGKLKELGVAGIERSNMFPNIHTLAESVPVTSLSAPGMAV